MNRRKEIETLRTEIEVLKQEVAQQRLQQTTGSGDDSEAKDKRNRLVQSGLEYWKAQYDSAKHFMTISLASTVAAGAIAGGVFIEYVRDYLYLTGSLLMLTFMFFLTCAVFSAIEMRNTSQQLWGMRDIDTEDDFYALIESSSFNSTRNLILITYSLGIFCIYLLGMIVLYLYGLDLVHKQVGS